MKYIIIVTILSIAGSFGVINKRNIDKTPVEFIEFSEPLYIIAKR